MTLLSLIYQGEVTLAENTKIIPKDDFSTIIETKALLAKAHEDIEKLQQETKEECIRLKEQAKEKGHKEGLESFNAHILALDAKVKEVKLEMQNMILPLAIQAMKKILGSELELKPEKIVDIVQQALKPVSQNYEIKILVSKEDREIIENNKDKIKSHLDHIKVFSIEERDDLESGSCRIETETGIINATLDSQFRALEAALKPYFKR